MPTFRRPGGPGSLALVLLVALAAAAPANTLRVPRLSGGTAQLDDDFGDLGDLDDGLDDLGGDPFGEDLGGGFGGDDFGGGDLGGDDFGLGGEGDGDLDLPDDPLLEGDLGMWPETGPVESGGLVDATPASRLEVDELLLAFADLLAELRTRKVRRPFHELSLRRLEVWIRAQAETLEPFGDSLTGRLDQLVAAARDPEASLPAWADAELARLRQGAPADRAADPLEGDLGALDDDLSFDSRWVRERSTPERPAPTSPIRSLDRSNPFRIYRLRNRLGQLILAPLDGPAWLAWLGQTGREDAALADGLAEAAGTSQGRSALAAALGSGISDQAAALVAQQLGEYGGADDLALLARLEKAQPGARYAVQLARGRLQERLDRYRGMDKWGRAHAAKTLLGQAKLMVEGGDLRRALRFAQEAADVAPDPTGARYWLGRYAYNLGYYQKAREAYEAALVRGVPHYSYVTNYAKCMRRLGQRDALIQALEGYLDRGGSTDLKVRFCNELALEYSALGDGDQAVRLARIGLGYHVPSEVEDNLLTRLAEGLTLQGKLTEAADTYRRALAMDPGYRKARTGLAVVEARQRRTPPPRPAAPAVAREPWEPTEPSEPWNPEEPDPWADDDILDGDDLDDIDFDF